MTVLALSELLERKSRVSILKEISEDFYSHEIGLWSSLEAFPDCLQCPQSCVGTLLTVPAAPVLAPLAIDISVSPPDDEHCEGRAGSCSSLNHWHPAHGSFQCHLWTPNMNGNIQTPGWILFSRWHREMPFPLRSQIRL